MARLAIAKAFLGEYAKLDKDVQYAVDAAITTFARHPHPGQHLEKPRHSRDDRIRLMPVDRGWRGVVLAPASGTAGAATDPTRDTYCLVTVLPQDKANAYDLVSAIERAPGQVTFVSGQDGPEELQLILAHPFAAWRTFLHPSQREIAYQARYAGPAQVTGGPGTGKTVTVLHRAAFLAARAARAEQVLRIRVRYARQGAPSRPAPGPATADVLATR